MNPLPRCRFVSILLLSGTLLGGTAPPAAAERPLLAGAEVVALVGLAGDVESERAYGQQLESLLSAAARAEPPPERMVLLLDGGEAGGLAPEPPPGLSVEVRPGNRAAWLALAEELRAVEGPPLTVFAWGHGGLQGSQPVFHVRGPRITPGDLLAAVEGSPRASDWVLFFAGSAPFADGLRGEGRRRLSSEASQTFRSAPVGLDLVLDRLRGRPGSGLEELARRSGPAIGAWYESQRLARTEEPSLWLGRGEPLLLAQLEPPAEAEEAPTIEEAVSAVVGSDPLASALEGAPPLPWPGVERVDPADFPGQPAVVLLRAVETTLADNPAVVEEREEIVQILTSEGAEQGDVQLVYWPPGEKLRILDAEVVLPDGRRALLDPGDVRESALSRPEGYSSPLQKAFSLPELEPGAVMRLRLERQWRRFPLPHVPLEMAVADELPVRRSRITVRVPKGSPLHWTFRTGEMLDGTSLGGAREGLEPELRATPYGEARTWSFENLPPWPVEL
ncbi:MAG: DUF3857 domain-containing protein, partial [Holophagales bacterium]|nr:DUF3857 domain-containing protein [Holophagales bacterium]